MRNGCPACNDVADAQPTLRNRKEPTMKTPTSIRVVALIAAVATTFVLVQSVALLASPPRVDAPQLAQAATPVLSR